MSAVGELITPMWVKQLNIAHIINTLKSAAQVITRYFKLNHFSLFL